MIKLEIPDREMFDNDTSEFTMLPGGTFKFEHSLKAIAMWEEKWEKPFLVKTPPHTTEESMDYFRCMCFDPSFDTRLLTPDSVMLLNEYIKKPATATVFNSSEKTMPNGQFTTSELLYARMAEAGLPFECDRWNINRLFVVFRIIANDQGEKKKMSQRESARQQYEINQQRLKAMHTKG